MQKVLIYVEDVVYPITVNFITTLPFGGIKLFLSNRSAMFLIPPKAVLDRVLGVKKPLVFCYDIVPNEDGTVEIDLTALKKNGVI